MYQRILVPTDGSDAARRGYDRGVELAREHGAELHVLYVVDERRHGATPAVGGMEAVIEVVEEDADAVLETLKAEAERLGVAVRTACLRGTPHETISEYAQQNGIDCIVIGKRGFEGDARMRPAPRRGSVSDRVEETSRCPVVKV